MIQEVDILLAYSCRKPTSVFFIVFCWSLAFLIEPPRLASVAFSHWGVTGGRNCGGFTSSTNGVLKGVLNGFVRPEADAWGFVTETGMGLLRSSRGYILTECCRLRYFSFLDASTTSVPIVLWYWTFRCAIRSRPRWSLLASNADYVYVRAPLLDCRTHNASLTTDVHGKVDLQSNFWKFRYATPSLLWVFANLIFLNQSNLDERPASLHRTCCYNIDEGYLHLSRRFLRRNNGILTIPLSKLIWFDVLKSEQMRKKRTTCLHVSAFSAKSNNWAKLVRRDVVDCQSMSSKNPHRSNAVVCPLTRWWPVLIKASFRSAVDPSLDLTSILSCLRIRLVYWADGIGCIYNSTICIWMADDDRASASVNIPCNTKLADPSRPARP